MSEINKIKEMDGIGKMVMKRAIRATRPTNR